MVISGKGRTYYRCNISGSFTGNFAIDEEVLQDVGVKDLDHYSHKPGAKLMPDFFVDSPEAEALAIQHGQYINSSTSY